MTILINDIKFTLRQLIKNPGFTFVAVLTLALCIGVNTAMLGVLYRVVLKPLPFPDSERLVCVKVHYQASDRIETEVSVSEFQALSTESGAFEKVAAFSEEWCNLSGVGMPRQTWGIRVTSEFFSTLGVTPAMGRLFSSEEYTAGRANIVLLSDGLWREHFGGRPDVLGKGFLLDGKVVTICGVMPPSFSYPRRYASYWAPFVPTAEQISDTNDRFLNVLGRMQSGVSVEQLGQRLQQLSRGYAEQQGSVAADSITFVARSLLKERLGGAGRILWILFGAVSCVTLIGSANLVNLYLTRLGKRHKELVVRMALGATIRNILCQWLTESCMLSLIAGLVGITFSVWFIRLLKICAPYGLPRAEEIAVDPVIVGYGFVVSLLVGMGMSVVPLVQVFRKSQNADVLRNRESDGYPAQPQRRFWLVATQTTIATLLLINAGLLWNSFRTVMRIDPGFSPARLLTARIALSSRAYDDENALRSFYRRLTERVEALPEVSGVAMVNALPLSGINFNRPFSIENLDTADELLEGDSLQANYTSVSTNYFQLMGISILAGRTFEPIDEEGAPVVIVNKSLAKRFFPEGQAVGQRIKLGPGQWRPWMTIVGVSEDIKDTGREAPYEPTFYVPYQHKEFFTYTIRGMFLIAKINAPAESVINRLRSELNALDPSLPLANIETMDARLHEDTASRRYHSTLMGLFAALALTLAVIGIFGVLSCVVSDRRREIGVRMALGSNRIELFRLILKQGLKPVLAGVFCGWVLAWASQNLLAGFLFGISPHDPVTFISVGLLFLMTATLACLLPAYRAAMVDPMEALRYE
ncbi:MAG: ABC transporter permease [Sedimentisphaerales bacterium]|nr:ABC transporter permease [Sedimentisphaerales bacterium]